MKRGKPRLRRRRGFTLMEMLIVLAIVGMLLALIGPRILSSGKQADEQTARAQIKLLQTCLDHYYLHMKSYPETEPGLQALVGEPTETEGAGTSSRWKGPYTKTGDLPKDPWGNEYHYRYPAEQGKGDLPDIWSSGPDGEEDTEDDITSWKPKDGESEDGLDELDAERELDPEPTTTSMPDGA